VSIPAVVLIDGEHYPPVVRDALRHAAGTYELRAAVFLGGAEKIERTGLKERAEGLYGLPVIFADEFAGGWPAGLEAAIERYRPEVVVDLSDEPVLGYVQRFRLASTSLARGVGYVGPDFHFSPMSSPRLCAVPSLSIIGTGKRVGKTALSGYVARVLQAAVPAREGRPGVVVIAMGRGGPGEPEVVDGTKEHLTAEDLLAWSRQGKHAASDYFEDAALSGVVTVGCRRCGGGMAGEPYVSNVAEGVELANGLQPGLIVLEGSGAAQPPVAADARLLIAGAHQPVDDIAGYLGAYRLLISDAVVLTMAEKPLATPDKVRAVGEAIEAAHPGIPVVPVTFRPRPMESIEGRTVGVFSTAPESQRDVLKGYLEERCGCRVELFSTSLADREALRRDLASEAMDRVDTVVTEIKAAAIDTVAEKAAELGLQVVFMDNLPVEVGPDGGLLEESGTLEELARELAGMAGQRFKER
jgi:cyclic 2,3-diphosphoglycerate synthase